MSRTNGHRSKPIAGKRMWRPPVDGGRPGPWAMIAKGGEGGPRGEL